MSVILILMIVILEPFNATMTFAEIPLRIGVIWCRHIAAYRSPSTSAPAIGWFFYTLTFVALLAILPDLLPENSRHQVTGLMPLASIAVSLLVVSPLLAFLSATTIVMAGFLAACAVLALLMAGLPTPYACIALFAVLGLVQGASFAAVPELNDTIEGQGLSNGAIAQMGNLGNTLGTPVLLLILNQSGVAGLLSTIIAIYATGCIAHGVLAYLRSLQPTNEALF
jgi:hypothetical protein